MDPIFSIHWVTLEADHSLNFRERSKFILKLETFLQRGLDCRVLIRAQDKETDDLILQLADTYQSNYIPKNPDPAILQAVKAAIGAGGEALQYASLGAAGFVVVDLTTEAMQEILKTIKPDIGITLVVDGLESVIEALSGIENAAEAATNFTSIYLGPASMLVCGAFKGFRIYQRAIKNKDRAVKVYTFKSLDSYDRLKSILSALPKLKPIDDVS